jgi:hypothetical protein
MNSLILPTGQRIGKTPPICHDHHHHHHKKNNKKTTTKQNKTKQKVIFYLCGGGDTPTNASTCDPKPDIS